MPELEFWFVSQLYGLIEKRLETFEKIHKEIEMVSEFTRRSTIKKILNTANPRVFCLLQSKLYFVGCEDSRIWGEADELNCLLESGN